MRPLLRPALDCLPDCDVPTSRSVRETRADLYDLTDAERARRLPSGRARPFDNRVSWALTYLARPVSPERPRRGHVRITL